MYHDSIVLYILKHPAHPPGVSKDKNSKHYLFLRLEQYFPHHTILHRKLCLHSCTHFLHWSLYCILFLSFKKNTHNRFSFLPILATMIPSFKMFKLCSLFPFFMPCKRVKTHAMHISLPLHQERLKSVHFLSEKAISVQTDCPLRCCDTFLFRLYLPECFFKMC